MATGTFFNPEPQLTVEVKEFTGKTAAKDTYTTISGLDVSKSGYTPIGLLGFYLSGSNATFCAPYAVRIPNGTTSAEVRVRNYSTSSAATLTIYLYVLYRKN